MEYEGRICRPPMERSSFMLPVMVGCSYNKCKFCNLFRDIKYRELALSEIEAELIRVKNLNGNLSKIFLGDGSAFDLKTEHLLKILNLIHEYFPDCNCINMDATITGILQKSDAELETLYAQDIRTLYIGIESGLDDVLLFMNKDHTMAEAERAISKIQKHGYSFGAHIMTGIAGKGRSIENAKATAEFLNKTKPVRVINFSMFLHKEGLLYKDIKSGKYAAASEMENLEEEKKLVELLGDDGSPIFYDGFHDYLEFRVRVALPKDRAKMLKIIQDKIENYKPPKNDYAFVNGECTPSLEKADGSGKIWKTVLSESC